jgi:hypothetical protein
MRESGQEEDLVGESESHGRQGGHRLITMAFADGCRAFKPATLRRDCKLCHVGADGCTQKGQRWRVLAPAEIGVRPGELGDLTATWEKDSPRERTETAKLGNAHVRGVAPGVRLESAGIWWPGVVTTI